MVTRNDESMGGDSYQRCPTIYDNKDIEMCFSVFTCKAITWEISRVPGGFRRRAYSER